MARSTTEAEYRSVADAIYELIWVQLVLQELGIPTTPPLQLWCDNRATTYLIVNPIFHTKMKHIAIHYHFDREFVDQKLLEMKFISMKEQLANILMKPLAKMMFHYLKDKLIETLSLSMRGSVKD